MGSDTNIVKPQGSLKMPSLLCGGCGALLAIVVSLSGLLKDRREEVSQFILQKDFYTEEMWQLNPEGEWAVACGISVCLAFFILDSCGFWRRFLLGLCAVVLTSSSVFTLALWGVLFVPLCVIIAITATVLFAILYASQHTMPCQLGGEVKVQKPQEEVKEEPEIIKVRDINEAESKDLRKTIKVAEKAVPVPKIAKPKKKTEKVMIKAKEKTNG